MLGGIIMLALPTTVFGAQFAEEYSSMKSDAALEILPNIHQRLHTYLGPSGRAGNFAKGECIMKDLRTGLIELYDFVDELSPNILVDDYHSGVDDVGAP